MDPLASRERREGGKKKLEKSALGFWQFFKKRSRNLPSSHLPLELGALNFLSWDMLMAGRSSALSAVSASDCDLINQHKQGKVPTARPVAGWLVHLGFIAPAAFPFNGKWTPDYQYPGAAETCVNFLSNNFTEISSSRSWQMTERMRRILSHLLLRHRRRTLFTLSTEQNEAQFILWLFFTTIWTLIEGW